MASFKQWLSEQIAEHKVEPNSGLGQAITYFTKHFDKLTPFLRVAGAPLDNNAAERGLKKAILHRKAALFYKTENGARVGVISGDTKFDETTTARFGEGCELLLHDCQHFPSGVHAFYGELKNLPQEMRNKMLLYHLTDGMLSIDVKNDGFMGLAEPAPVVYDFLD